MRRFYASLAVMLAIFALILWHIQAVERETDLLADTLIRAEQALNDGRREEALELTEEAQREWQRVENWFGVVLRMEDTEEVDGSFYETLVFLRSGEGGEYYSANAVLVENLRRLAEMEQLHWGSIF